MHCLRLFFNLGVVISLVGYTTAPKPIACRESLRNEFSFFILQLHQCTIRLSRYINDVNRHKTYLHAIMTMISRATIEQQTTVATNASVESVLLPESVFVFLSRNRSANTLVC